MNYYPVPKPRPSNAKPKKENIIVRVGSSFKKDFGLILVGAIIFVASFMWKDLLTDVKEKYFPKQAGFYKRVLYVVIVTLILLVLAVIIRNVFGLSNAGNGNASANFDDSPLDRSGISLPTGTEDVDIG